MLITNTKEFELQKLELIYTFKSTRFLDPLSKTSDIQLNGRSAVQTARWQNWRISVGKSESHPASTITDLPENVQLPSQ